MIEEVNKLYLDAPNDDCYYSVVPHRLDESKEGSREKFESALYLTFAITVRQDRKTIHDILRIVGKDHIWEKKDAGEGTEGSYRYSTKYSIFEKYTINDIEFDDYDVFNNVPRVIERIHLGFKTDDGDRYLEDVRDMIGELDYPSTSAITMLSTVSKALKRARAINNNYINSLLDKAHSIYVRQGSMGKDLLQPLINAYYVASHPDSGYDRKSLFDLRTMLIVARIQSCEDSDISPLLLRDDCGLLPLLKTADKELQESDTVCDDSDIIDLVRYGLRYFSFMKADYHVMERELERHYHSCKQCGRIHSDYSLMVAIHRFIYPKEWVYSKTILDCLNNLIALYQEAPEKSIYSTWMLLLFLYLRQYLQAANEGFPQSHFNESSRYKFDLISSFEPNAITIMVAQSFPEDLFHDLLDYRREVYHTRYIEKTILDNLWYDLSDISRSLINNDFSFLSYLSAEKAIRIYEEMLRRYCYYAEVGCGYNTPALLNCRLSLALLHDYLTHEKEALVYYSAVKEMYENGEAKLSDEMIRKVSERIKALSCQ